MQPTFVQVPPGAGPPCAFFQSSMQAVANPSCAARIAAMYPPGPPPITTTSKFLAMNVFRDVFAARYCPSRGTKIQRTM